MTKDNGKYDYTQSRRVRRRCGELNEMAKSLGFATHSKLLTALLHAWRLAEKEKSSEDKALLSTTDWLKNLF